MAIRLASAIGQQREPVGILGGVDDAINKTGDAIQADLDRKADAAAKKKDQEQRLKDAIAKTLVTEPLDKAFPEEKKEYDDLLKKGVLEYAVMQQDPNVTPSQLKQFGDDLQFKLEDRRNVYGRAYDAFTNVAKKDDKGTHDTALFNNWFLGKENTQVADMPNDDFMAASEVDRAGKMVGENGMQATETKVTSQTVPYLNKSFEEKKKIDFATKADELVSLKRPDTLSASRGYYGKPFEFEAYTVRTDKVSPTTGEYIFKFNEGQVDLDAKKFASSMVGEGNFGNKEHAQYQRALENEALVAGNEAGFSGERLAAFVAETVPQMAYDDFMLNARSAYDKRIKNDKDITKAPSKGMTFNNNLGGGGSETPDGVFIPKETPLLSDDELKSYVKEKDAERYGRWRTEYNKMHENDKEKKEESEIKEIYKRELSKPSKNNPNLTIQQWNEQQARKEADNAKKGLTAISFTPKGKDNWFSAKTNDGVTRKIIPKTIYKNDKGELVKVEGYNVDESTDKVKIDLEEFEVDTKNEANRNSFIGKYPTSIEAAEINIPTKVVVSGKQGVGIIQGKRAAVKEVNISFADYVKAYEKAKGKKATPEVIEKLKIKFQSK